MMRKHHWVAIVLACSSARAGLALEKDSNTFLMVGAGGRANGMAEAYTAIGEGVFGMLYNPAGLALENALGVGLQHTSWLLDFNNEMLGAVLPLGHGTLGIITNYFNYGNMRGWDISGLPNGQDFNPFDLALSTGYGMEIAPRWRAGAMLTVTQGYIDHYNFGGLGASLGCLWESAWPGIGLGLALKDLGASSGGFTWPSRLSMGAVARGLYLDGLLAALDLSIPMTSGYFEAALGVEYTYRDTVSLRMGYRLPLGDWQASLPGLSLGFGVAWRRIQFDYAMQPLGTFNLAHRASLAYTFPPLFVTLGQIKQEAEQHYQKGAEYEKNKDWVAALVEYRIAVSLQPDWEKARQAMASAQAGLDKDMAEQKARQEEAKKEMAAAIQKAGEAKPGQKITGRAQASGKEDSLQKQLHIAQGYSNEGAYKKSLTLIKMILELNPEHAQARELQKQVAGRLAGKQKELYKQAAEARRKGDKESEKAIWQRAMILDPDDALAVREYQKLIQEMMVPVETVDEKDSVDQNELIEKQKKRLQW